MAYVAKLCGEEFGRCRAGAGHDITIRQQIPRQGGHAEIVAGRFGHVGPSAAETLTTSLRHIDRDREDVRCKETSP